jgi:hypothetical protein
MSAAETTTTEAVRTLSRSAGLPGRMAVSWSMAGGIILGGYVVALMTLTGTMSANAVLLTATALFIVGALAGFVHGAVLGAFGQDPDAGERSVGRSVAMGALYAVPGLAVAWLLAAWISMTVVASYVGSSTSYMIVGAGWIGGALVLSVAGVQGWRALSAAYARWPEWRLGTALVAGTFAALLVLFLADRPELWGVHLRVSPVGAVLLAAVAATWIAGPIVTVGLYLLRKIPTSRTLIGSFEVRGMGGDLGVGLATGLIMGLLATPFLSGLSPMADATSTSEMLVTAVSAALVDEVLLRLFLTTAVAWLLLQWHRVTRNEALVLSVIIAALVQVLLYTPGALAAGFPSTPTAMGWMGAAVLLPSLAFGALYWTRGFRTAFVAHSAALMVLAVVAL